MTKRSARKLSVTSDSLISRKFTALHDVEKWLNGMGFYRKYVARDSSSVFRIASNKKFGTQVYHPLVYQHVLHYSKLLCPNQFLKISMQNEISLEQYLFTLSNSVDYKPSLVDIYIISNMYKFNFTIYHKMYASPLQITNCEQNPCIVIYTDFKKVFDILYTEEYYKVKAWAQSVVYEIYYKMMFQVKNVDYARQKMLQQEDNTDSTSLPLETQDSLALVSVDATPLRSTTEYAKRLAKRALCTDMRKLLDAGITPFPYKVAKSLDPDMYRNVEFDVWLDVKKKCRNRMTVWSNTSLVPGVTCMVHLPDGKTSGIIQEVEADEAKVFVPALKQMMILPQSCLEPLPRTSEDLIKVTQRRYIKGPCAIETDGILRKCSLSSAPRASIIEIHDGMIADVEKQDQYDEISSTVNLETTPPNAGGLPVVSNQEDPPTSEKPEQETDKHFLTPIISSRKLRKSRKINKPGCGIKIMTRQANDELVTNEAMNASSWFKNTSCQAQNTPDAHVDNLAPFQSTDTALLTQDDNWYPEQQRGMYQSQSPMTMNISLYTQQEFPNPSYPEHSTTVSVTNASYPEANPWMPTYSEPNPGLWHTEHISGQMSAVYPVTADLSTHSESYPEPNHSSFFYEYNADPGDYFVNSSYTALDISLSYTNEPAPATEYTPCWNNQCAGPIYPANPFYANEPIQGPSYPVAMYNNTGDASEQAITSPVLHSSPDPLTAPAIHDPTPSSHLVSASVNTTWGTADNPLPFVTQDLSVPPPGNFASMMPATPPSTPNNLYYSVPETFIPNLYWYPL